MVLCRYLSILPQALACRYTHSVNKLILLKTFNIMFQVRKRPLSKKEISRKEGDIISVDDNMHITVQEPKLKVCCSLPFPVF